SSPAGNRRRRLSEDPEVITPLQLRAAEAAFAAGRPARAVAYVESVLGSFDARRDRVAIGLLHERLGRYRRAAGDRAGSLAALEREGELVPDEADADRAALLPGAPPA